ncbi:hypothetical protein ARMGADRAFT_585260 [Armillaria gallica]|uniref:Uncharacterized protein n=1 Tax=Armillaria gallica TaxID=47427 RepID=A0A2H3E636_ARMGA|nr:hypothetical protein ARMGADRAFT_585260 [Armillaria gallica]
MEQADDGAIFSSAEGVQTHLDELGPWTCRKALRVNIQKTKTMEKVQHKYLCRLLHLYSRSMIDVLWSETGVCDRYLAKVLELEDGWERISVCCLEAKSAMTRWEAVGDLAFVLGKIGVLDGERTLEALTEKRVLVAISSCLCCRVG